MSRGDGARTGVLGGTFNPVHLAHLRAAEEVADALDLARVLFVPSALPPHKSDDEGDPIAPAAERLTWVRLAVEDNPRFAADSIEVDRGGRSYLVETLEALGRRLGQRPVFLLGSDAFAEIQTWRRPEVLVTLADLAVMTRPGSDRGALGELLPPGLAELFRVAPDGRSARHRSAGSHIQLVEITPLDVSASDVRRRLREGRSVRYLLPEAVRRAVIASGAYPPGPAADPNQESPTKAMRTPA